MGTRVESGDNNVGVAVYAEGYLLKSMLRTYFSDISTELTHLVEGSFQYIRDGFIIAI